MIVRTAGAGRGKAEIKRDYEYLVRLWSSIREMTLQSTAPTLVYEEASLIKRSIWICTVATSPRSLFKARRNTVSPRSS